jgi:hypothetical protein
MDIITLFSFFGMSYAIKEAELFAVPRNWLMQRSAFMAKLLYCWWCVGFWAGAFVYLLHSGSANAFEEFNPFEWIVWGCAGSAVSALGNAVMNRLDFQLVDTNTNQSATDNNQR